jgi:hypothetical protein
MNVRWLMLGIAGLGLALGTIAADPAQARARKKPPAACQDRPTSFSWERFIFNGPPQPNGCAPAVIDHGVYIGQDPDPNIRAQLRRDPRTGFVEY